MFFQKSNKILYNMNPETLILNTSIIFIFGVLFIVSFLFFKFPPKSINAFYGYRTYQSMQNIENWNFAKAVSSKFMIKSTIFSFIVAFIFQNTITDLFIDYKIFIILGIYIIPLLMVFPYTEKKLKEFNKSKII